MEVFFYLRYRLSLWHNLDFFLVCLAEIPFYFCIWERHFTDIVKDIFFGGAYLTYPHIWKFLDNWDIYDSDTSYLDIRDILRRGSVRQYCVHISLYVNWTVTSTSVYSKQYYNKTTTSGTKNKDNNKSVHRGGEEQSPVNPTDTPHRLYQFIA